MKTARFLAAARLEFFAEIIYYNNAQPGLGARFAAAIEEATVRALAFPASGMTTRGRTQRVLVKDFPFSIVYHEESDGILVVAIAHHAQRPVLVAIAHTCPLTTRSTRTLVSAAARRGAPVIAIG